MGIGHCAAVRDAQCDFYEIDNCCLLYLNYITLLLLMVSSSNIRPKEIARDSIMN